MYTQTNAVAEHNFLLRSNGFVLFWVALLQTSVLSNSGSGNSASNSSSSTGMKPAGASKKRRWYLGIQSKKEAAHVMTEVYRAVSDKLRSTVRACNCYVTFTVSAMCLVCCK
jgi:hypothetical protein